MQIDKKINAGKLFSSSLAFILNIQRFFLNNFSGAGIVFHLFPNIFPKITTKLYK